MRVKLAGLLILATDATLPGSAEARRRLAEEIEGLLVALEESVRLQSHYAAILNDNDDGGMRLTFASAEEWVEHLAALKRERASR